jgi:anaerobic magnesium-protoporphyrin IX monomethyl ester cyclase
MKIALVQCPVWGTYDPPLALAQLAGCLKKENHEVFVFDLNIKLYIARRESYKHLWAWEQWMFWRDEKNVDKFFQDNQSLIGNYVDGIINSRPKAVGFSVNSASRLFSIKLARMIKKIDKKVIIIFGGPLFFEKIPTEQILDEGAVDIVMFAEGESTLSELVRLIDNKQDLANCAGIAFKDQGRLVRTRPREPIANLDALPFLDFSGLPLSDYDDCRHLAFMASRGCIRRCVFCSSSAFWPGYRAMSGERIFREIEFQKRQLGETNPHLGHIDFLDLVFNGNMNSLVKFCESVIESGLKIFWNANMIVRSEMTFDVIGKMKRSGCKHVIFGIESGSQRVLDLMQKHYRLEDADRIIQEMHGAGIIVTCNFMFGFPGETDEDFQETLDFIKRNAGSLDRVYPSRTYCGIEESSYIYDHLEEFGIKPDPGDYLFWESIDGTNTYPERLRRCREFSRLAVSLGIEVGSGVQTSVQQDEESNLLRYYKLKQGYKNTVQGILHG